MIHIYIYITHNYWSNKPSKYGSEGQIMHINNVQTHSHHLYMGSVNIHELQWSKHTHTSVNPLV